MKNKEKYVKEIVDIACNTAGMFGVKRSTGLPMDCSKLKCGECLFINFSSCPDGRKEYADEYVEAVTKWVTGDAAKKKEISIEKCSYMVIMDTDRNIVYKELLKVGDDYGDVFKRYCEEHDGTYRALIECWLSVKED